MSPESMRAAVLEDVGRIVVRDLARPRAGAGEVVLDVEAVGLCGTDFHIFSGEANYNRDASGRAIPLRDVPQVLGHEIVGRVRALGKGAEGLEVGDRVVVDQGRTCVSGGLTPCEYCRTGDSHQCDRYAEHGITGLPGGLADQIAVPAVNAIRATADILPEHIVMTEPLACVLHSVEMWSRTPARYRLEANGIRSILICGAGPAGLLFVQVLRREYGFDGEVIVSDPSAHKRALAQSFGATVVDPATTDLTSFVAERTKGRRVDALVDAAGAGELFALVPGLLRKQGTFVLYAHGHGGTDLSALNQVQFLEPTLIASAGASGGHHVDRRPAIYARALGLIESGMIDVAPLVTHRYHSLAQVPAAFAGAHRSEGYVKAVVLTSA